MSPKVRAEADGESLIFLIFFLEQEKYIFKFSSTTQFWIRPYSYKSWNNF